MNPNDPQPEPVDPTPIDDPDLEAFIDGAMNADEAEAFTRRLEDDPGRTHHITMQQRIDARLRDQLEWTAATPPALPGLGEETEPPATSKPNPTSVLYRITRPLRLIAAVLMLALIGVVVAVVFKPSDSNSLVAVYHAEVDAGFVPGWVCETDAEFIDTFVNRFQTPLRLREAAGIEAIGLTYNYALGPQTVMLLARVDGEPVIVFIGSTRLVDKPPRVGNADLSLFEHQIGLTRMFELTPFDAPRVLEHFELAESIPEESD